jgi:2-polyprenyl-3-methyl-5-hydroxy-6-metoxy-1,4-benzoquinol methylase
MAKVKSAKDILISTDFLEAREKAGRYVHHEFQDYGLRLAHDLGDLPHKLIYLKLAKTVDRTLLEQAAAFALGYFDEQNKGKLFMWKVQQLRKLYQQKKDTKNLDHEFVMAKTAEVVNALHQVYYSRYKADFESTTQELVQMIVSQYSQTATQTPDKTKILLIGVGAGLEAKALCGLGFKVQGFDISARMIKQAKVEAKAGTFVKKKHFLENVLKDKTYEMVLVHHRLWELVPLQAEPYYFNELHRLVKPNGVIYLGMGLADDEAQSWQEFTWEEETYIRFTKQNSLNKLIEKLPKGLNSEGMVAANYCKLLRLPE